MESHSEDNSKTQSRSKTVTVLIWLSIGLDILFFLVLNAQVDIYGYPRGYERFFNLFDSAGRHADYSFALLAGAFAYVAYTNSTDDRLTSGTLLIFNVTLFLVSIILNIYVLLN